MPPKKKIAGLIKLQIQAGAATPAPPVGPALGQHGVNIMEFCKQYNSATEAQRGNVVPVEITVYEDRTFSFITKTPPAARLILKAAGVEKGSGEPHVNKVATISRAQVREIAESKMADLNANDLDGRVEPLRRRGLLRELDGLGGRVELVAVDECRGLLVGLAALGHGGAPPVVRAGEKRPPTS